MIRRLCSALAVAALLSGCGIPGPAIDHEPEVQPEPQGPRELKSDKQRITAPNVPPADALQLSENNTDFAFSFYRAVRATTAENLVLSPHSLQTALAMTYAGARGNTATEMKTALQFQLPDDRLHPAFNALDLQLASRGVGQTGIDGQPFRLRSVNATWGQDGYNFLPAYLDTLALHYGAGLRVLDFATQPEPSRVTINDWVSQQTESRIPELLPQGSVQSSTALVLTNAVYFNASWSEPFHASQTTAKPFTKLDGSTTTVQMMKRTASGRYTDAGDYVIATMPYAGDELEFVIILPDSGKFAQVEAMMSTMVFESALANTTGWDIELSLPKFKVNGEVPAKDALRALGIKDLFTDGAADLSGIDGTKSLVVTDVKHKVFMDLTEKGTEAAAATGVVIGPTSAPPTVPVTVDRPFLFAIRDRATKSVVFVGGIVSPAY